MCELDNTLHLFYQIFTQWSLMSLRCQSNITRSGLPPVCRSVAWLKTLKCVSPHRIRFLLLKQNGIHQGIHQDIKYFYFTLLLLELASLFFKIINSLKKENVKIRDTFTFWSLLTYIYETTKLFRMKWNRCHRYYWNNEKPHHLILFSPFLHTLREKTK